MTEVEAGKDSKEQEQEDIVTPWDVASKWKMAQNN